MLKKIIKKIIALIPQVKNLTQKSNDLQGKLEALQAKFDAVVQERDQLLARRKSEYYEYLTYLYKYLLDREAEEAEIQGHNYSLQSPSEIMNKFLESPEYQMKLQQKEIEKREYITCLYNYLLKREPEEAEIVYHLLVFQNPSELLKIFIESEEYQKKQEYLRLDLSFLGAASYVIGESKPISANRIFNWYQTAAQLLNEQNNKTRFLPTELNNRPCPLLQPEHNFSLTIITSLYQGEKYLKAFMENMIDQTIFSQCQLFIVDANSPENEYEIVQPYLHDYPNIKYLKLDKKIDIYEAWNLAIKESKSEFITNANVDDLHRKDAFELKIKALRDCPKIDIVYSDFYYSFLANMPFEIVEKCGIKTNLPTANKFNLLTFNSPHNSPLWRRTIHEKIGYFDTAYKSAGDYEFWLRAAFAGSKFLKIPEPLVIYYQNPQGMSTKDKTPSLVEIPKIIEKYRSHLQEL